MILCQVSFQISGPLWVHSLLHWQHHTGLVCRGPEVCSNGNSESNLGCILIIRLYFKYSTYHTIHIYPYLSISYPTYPASTHPRSQLRRSSGTPARISCKCLLFWSLLCFCFISILYISIYFYFIYFYILYIIFPLFLYISMYFLWWLSSSLNRNLLNYASLDLWIIHNLPTKNTTQIYSQYTISAYLQYPPSRSCGGRPIFKALRRNAAAPSGCTSYWMRCALRKSAPWKKHFKNRTSML